MIGTSYKSHYQQFEIPDTWKWTTLEELIILISGQDFPSDKYSSTPKGVPYIIGASNIQNGKVVVTRWTESPTVLSEKNDLLIVCKGAGVGKMGINQIGTSHIARQIQALRPFSRYVSLEYIRVALMNGIEIICSQANGLIPGLPRDLLLKFPIPLPPLVEQMKIVNRIASALDNINALEMEARAAQDYISLLKSKILDLAMQGKLVPQDPADEPAADMLMRINPKAKIITDNPHYPQLPDNWVLVSLEDITEYEQPQSYIVRDTSYSDKYTTPVLTAGKSFVLGYTNENFGIYENVPAIIFDDFTTDSRLVNFQFKVKSSAMKIIQVKYGLNIEYVALFMSITKLIGETHKRYWISEYSKILIPIPPLKEQDRIVERVNVLYHELDKIISLLSV